jgi:hypothetical protein
MYVNEYRRLMNVLMSVYILKTLLTYLFVDIRQKKKITLEIGAF